MSATNRGSERIPKDFYPTPEWAVDVMLPLFDFSKCSCFLEPCRGSGVIYNKVPMKNKQWAELSKGRDYLKDLYDLPENSIIITNPPFSLALEFLGKSLWEAGTVCYLLPLNFLGSIKRHEFWKANPPTHLFPLSRRPSFTGKGTDACDYAWFVWDCQDICEHPKGTILPLM
jgi:hypothetical protein